MFERFRRDSRCDKHGRDVEQLGWNAVWVRKYEFISSPVRQAYSLHHILSRGQVRTQKPYWLFHTEYLLILQYIFASWIHGHHQGCPQESLRQCINHSYSRECRCNDQQRNCNHLQNSLQLTAFAGSDYNTFGCSYGTHTGNHEFTCQDDNQHPGCNANARAYRSSSYFIILINFISHFKHG